ncbi:hypothetical protein EVAR_85519_1 [Eumeta japonica]|uniref:Uncharacterized protein n=1 Tax=Eumeta variegata TaxID=151549 RepID=A0A4C1VBN8_EUMVA|nr:hypothetical protein EVAR_85519_1 [Eumeta japonica]
MSVFANGPHHEENALRVKRGSKNMKLFLERGTTLKEGENHLPLLGPGRGRLSYSVDEHHEGGYSVYGREPCACVVEGRGAYRRAARLCPVLDRERSGIECVIGTDRLDCLRRMNKRTVDFGVFSPEDLLAARWAELDVLVTNELRSRHISKSRVFSAPTARDAQTGAKVSNHALGACGRHELMFSALFFVLNNTIGILVGGDEFGDASGRESAPAAPARH